MQDFRVGALSSNGAVMKYLQTLRGNMRISRVFVHDLCVCVFVYVDFDQTPVIQSPFLWSLPACQPCLGAKSVTCVRAVKYRRLCWHTQPQRNGCQTSRGRADANQETGRTRTRTVWITITLITQYSQIWQRWLIQRHSEDYVTDNLWNNSH